MNNAWNAGKYTSNFSFVPEYGKDVLSWIEAPPGCTALDLGCGNGDLTQALQERGYEALGMDASPEFLVMARERHPLLSFIPGEATCFTLPEPVGIVFSNAVFHWVDQKLQPKMLRCIHRALKEQGELVFEMGGCGNNQCIHRALAAQFTAHGHPYSMPFYFPTIAEYASLLEQNGFCVRKAVLFDRPTRLLGEEGMRDWIHMFIKAPFNILSSEQEKESIINQAVGQLKADLYRDGQWYADYVRLRIRAIRLPKPPQA